MKHQPFCACHHFSIAALFLSRDLIQGTTLLLIVVSLVRFGLRQVFGLSLFLLILTVLSSGQYPVECGPVWVCLVFFLGLDGADALREGAPAREHVLVVTSPREVHDVTHEVTFIDCTVKSMSFSFPALFSGSESLSWAHPSGRAGSAQPSEAGAGLGSQDHPQLHQFGSTSQHAGARGLSWREEAEQTRPRAQVPGRRLEEARQELPRGATRWSHTGHAPLPLEWVVTTHDVLSPGKLVWASGCRVLPRDPTGRQPLPVMSQSSGLLEGEGCLVIDTKCHLLGSCWLVKSRSPPSPAVQAGLCTVVSGPQW